MRVTIEIDNDSIISAFIQDLRARKAGSGKIDHDWFNKQISRAERGNPDRRELGLFIAFQAGFQSVNGYYVSDFELKP
jgi:hypothetical protein